MGKSSVLVIGEWVKKMRIKLKTMQFLSVVSQNMFLININL